MDQRPEIAERWATWREEKQSRIEDDQGDGMNSATVFAALSEAASEDADRIVLYGPDTDHEALESGDRRARNAAADDIDT